MTRETKLGLTLVISVVVALGLLIYGAFALLQRGISETNRLSVTAGRIAAQTIAAQSAPSEIANVNLFVDGPFTKDYAASAILELPPVPRQRDAPSVQLGFTERNASVQGGIMRAPSFNFRLKAFVSYSWPNTGQTTFFLRTLKDGPHKVELRARNNSLGFFVDGEELYLLPDVGSPDPWLFVGTAVKYPGDTASGTISDIRVQRDGDRALVPYRPVCIVSNGGLHVVADGARWILRGTNVRGIPLAYDHCQTALMRHRLRYSLLRTSAKNAGHLVDGTRSSAAFHQKPARVYAGTS